MNTELRAAELHAEVIHLRAEHERSLIQYGAAMRSVLALQQQVHDMANDIAALRMQNEDLQDMNEALNSICNIRDAHINELRAEILALSMGKGARHEL